MTGRFAWSFRQGDDTHIMFRFVDGEGEPVELADSYRMMLRQHDSVASPPTAAQVAVEDHTDLGTVVVARLDADTTRGIVWRSGLAALKAVTAGAEQTVLEGDVTVRPEFTP
jgi:hypothetical protein